MTLLHRFIRARLKFRFTVHTVQVICLTLILGSTLNLIILWLILNTMGLLLTNLKILVYHFYRLVV